MKKDINKKILKQLIHNDDFVSGSSIAKKIGVSRVSVWSHLEKLKNCGFEFEASTNKGYKLKQLPGQIQQDLLESYLEELNVSEKLFHYSSIDSTNSQAERLLSSSNTSPIIVTANHQSHGRGRQGRSWSSSQTDNIYLSLGLKIQIPTTSIPAITPFIALHICQWLKNFHNIPVQIKWPNDLHIDGKKFSGMLAESRIDIDQTRDTIFGIGLNLNSPKSNFQEDLAYKATSLKASTQTHYNINEFCAQLIHILLNAFNKFIQEGPTQTFQDLWSQYDALAGKPITANFNNTQLHGTSTGITSEGMLKFTDAKGKIHTLNSAEISLSNKL